MKNFSEIETRFAIPREFDYAATKRNVFLGPGTKIQVTGKLLCQKIAPAICSADLLGFLCRFGGGGLPSAVVDWLRAVSRLRQRATGFGPGPLTPFSRPALHAAS